MATLTQVLEIVDMYTGEYVNGMEVKFANPKEPRDQIIFLYKDESAGVAGPTEKEKDMVNELMGLLDFAGLVTEEEVKHKIVNESQQEVLRAIEDLIGRGCQGDTAVSMHSAEVLANLESRLNKMNKVMKLNMFCMPYIADASGGESQGKNLTGSSANSSATEPTDRPTLTLEDLAKGKFLRFIEEVQRGQEANGYYPTVKSITPWVWAQFCNVVGPHSSDKAKHEMSGIDIPDSSMDELVQKCLALMDTSKVRKALTAVLGSKK